MDAAPYFVSLSLAGGTHSPPMCLGWVGERIELRSGEVPSVQTDTDRYLVTLTEPRDVSTRVGIVRVRYLACDIMDEGVDPVREWVRQR